MSSLSSFTHKESVRHRKMGDVIEACADGGFDIPTTRDTAAGPLHPVKTQSSATMVK